MSSEKNSKVNVQEGCYLGKKWFLKIPYKVIETDVSFRDEVIYFHQYSGFVRATNNYHRKVVRYNDIRHVTTNRMISTPNIIFAVICGILAVVTEIWAILILIAFVLFMGSTAVTTVLLKNGETYKIPTEFKSEADELQLKINTAMAQARG